MTKGSEKPRFEVDVNMAWGAVLSAFVLIYAVAYIQPERGSVAGAYVCQADPEYCGRLDDPSEAPR